MRDRWTRTATAAAAVLLFGQWAAGADAAALPRKERGAAPVAAAARTAASKASRPAAPEPPRRAAAGTVAAPAPSFGRASARPVPARGGTAPRAQAAVARPKVAAVVPSPRRGNGDSAAAARGRPAATATAAAASRRPAARPPPRQVAHPADSVPRPAAATAEAPPAEQGRARVAAAVRAAAAASGFDPEMLLAIAMAESSLREGARNPRSTAAGPLQFTTPTWLAAVHAYADRIPALARHRRRMMELASRDIALGGSALPPRQRRPMLAALRREQAAARGAALALRHDAAVAARVAAVLAQDDADRFRALTGARPAGPGEIYAIHLLGVGVAADLARAERQRPAASVEGVLPPGVLRANREIFRGEGGRALTVREAQARIAARLRPPETTELVQLAEAP